MRTTKKQAAQTLGKAIVAFTNEADGRWDDMSDEYLEAVCALGDLFREFSDGDPRGRKPKAEPKSDSKFVGGEQVLFRA